MLLVIFLCAATSALNAQTTPLDPRISKHYTPQQIEEMSASNPLKIKYLTVYYSSSYLIHNNAGTELDPLTVDVTPFEHLRQQDKRVSAGYSRQGHVIELLSKNELEALYKKIN
ncbi:MAG: hypothetical protein M3R27_04840 [Bacteroidota bacterium]|nr:hypothetical protein [Bacteroidota bacterium]